MLKRNLFFLFAFTVFALASTVLDIFNYNPFQANLSVFANFYGSFFCALTGILGMIIFYFKVKLANGEWKNEMLAPSVRQAAFISLSLTCLLVLQGLKLLDWWVGGPLVISIILLELYFQTASPQLKHQKKIKKNKLV